MAQDRVYLTLEEVTAARDAVRLVLRAAVQFGVDTPEYLGRLERLVERLDRECVHCGFAPKRSSEGHCAACAQYKAANNTLPPAHVLDRRFARMEEQRLSA